MIDSSPDCSKANVPGGKSRWVQRGVLGATCALVIGVYAYTAQSGWLESFSLNPADTYYNLLVQGFRAGQLSLKKDVPPGLAQLADPYDPTANILYRSDSCGTLDLSYYKGRFYLYFGVTPALILFWPFVALTGHYLFHRQAVTMFCAIGFLVSVGLLRALWRRYFAEVRVGVVVAGALALGLATGVPVLLVRCDVYEVPISCGYMLTMLALGAIWRALHEPKRSWRWLAAASLAYGLALGARPTLLFGAVILLVPVIQAWRERRKIWALLMAATGPIILIGLGLMLYNALRFDNPLEFGDRLQLNGEGQVARQAFSLRWLWFNIRVNFLEPARWSGHFPFVHEISVPPLPAGHDVVQAPFGVLTNIPLVWLALAVWLAWRGRLAEARTNLRWFLAAVALFVVVYALTICLYFGACFRYEVEFLPALVLLAMVGILGLERALVGRPLWRCTVRWSWSLLLAFSVAFNLLASVLYRANGLNRLGLALAREERRPEAIQTYEQALRLQPDNAEAHNNLGNILLQQGKVTEATAHYEQALRLQPDNAEAHNNLGNILLQQGKVPEAIAQYEQALRIKPDSAEAHNNLGNVLFHQGKASEAIGHFEQALRIKPDSAEAHNNLGNVLLHQGKASEAITQYEQALRFQPDSAGVHYNLGVALEQAGRVPEAIGHFEQSLRIKPDFAEARKALAKLRAVR